MSACEEIRAFLTMAEGGLHDPVAGKAPHIRALPASVQFQLTRAISAIGQDRYDQREMKRAAEMISAARNFSGGLGEAVRAMTHAVIDNGGFAIM